ncbi:MAG: hypothetical protein KME47_10120 [Nodosilinea sp. WJT8-NPBG4]|jgi:hypothetical protein|nr:hypothetical protein [Nodosilinea sp. WJT8-NPBG4]
MIIYRYALTDTETILQIPDGHIKLHVGWSDLHSELSVWISVNPNTENKAVKFRLVMTGEQVDKLHHMSYLGTVQRNNIVTHVFFTSII